MPVEDWVQAIVGVLQDWHEALLSGSANVRKPDPFDTEIDQTTADYIVERVIDARLDREVYWHFQAHFEHSGAEQPTDFFARMTPGQRIAMCQDLLAAKRRFPDAPVDVPDEFFDYVYYSGEIN